MVEHPEACPEWRDDLAVWLVAQIDPEREAALADHVAACATCRHEATSLTAVAAVSLPVDPDAEAVGSAEEEPSPALGDRVVGRVAAERRSRRVLVAATLVVAAVVVVGALALRPDGTTSLEGPTVEFALVPPGAEARAIVARDAGGSLVELVASGLDPEVTYALWLSPSGGAWEDRVPAGTFRPDAEGAVETRLPCALPAEQAGRIWATTPEGEIALDTD